jgi:hypothetical protein
VRTASGYQGGRCFWKGIHPKDGLQLCLVWLGGRRSCKQTPFDAEVEETKAKPRVKAERTFIRSIAELTGASTPTDSGGVSKATEAPG